MFQTFAGLYGVYRARKNGKNGFGLTEICWSIFSGFSASEADLQHPNIEEETKEPSEAPVAPGPSNLIAPGDEVMPETLCSSAPAQLHDCARAFSSFDMNNCIPSPVKTASLAPAMTSPLHWPQPCIAPVSKLSHWRLFSGTTLCGRNTV